jgi:hypothetical protein
MPTAVQARAQQRIAGAAQAKSIRAGKEHDKRRGP